MSRAFVKEDARTDAELVPPRPPLPDGVENLVTERGWRLLHEERDALQAERERLDAAGAPVDVVEERLEALLARIASARVTPPDGRDGVVRFGATVDVEVSGARRPATQRLTLVGVDEADPTAGRVAFVSPIGRALLGARVGEEVAIDGAGETRRWRVRAIVEADEGAEAGAAARD
ncbi:MAG: GreA/GreB family elongation factor [Trueperaceae bacterium]